MHSFGHDWTSYTFHFYFRKVAKTWVTPNTSSKDIILISRTRSNLYWFPIPLAKWDELASKHLYLLFLSKYHFKSLLCSANFSLKLFELNDFVVWLESCKPVCKYLKVFILLLDSAIWLDYPMIKEPISN